MEPVQALAILSLGAFLTVLVTAVFYIVTVRPRLLEPIPPDAVGVVDQMLRNELAEQRSVVAELNAALAHHTQQLESSAAGTGLDEDGKALLRAQSEAVDSLKRLLGGHSDQLAGLADRLSGQETALSRLAEQVDIVLPGIAAQVNEQGAKLNLLTRDISPTDALARLETRIDQLDDHLSEASPTTISDQLTVLIEAQAEKLLSLSARLDEWAAASTQRDQRLAEHARILAELDREMAVQAPILQRLDSRVSEHTTMLVTASAERREQIGILERVLGDLGRLVPLIGQIITAPARPDQDRLTDIKGIGPVYAGRLYEAGIRTFKQLGTMTPEELHTLIGEPEWRRRSVDAESWIEQATNFASQREKVENLP